MTGWRFLVTGAVQGVGYRRFVERAAAGLGLVGSVRNLRDGRVEVLAWGDPKAVDQLEGKLNIGPIRSYVTKVERVEISEEIAAPSAFLIDG